MQTAALPCLIGAPDGRRAFPGAGTHDSALRPAHTFSTLDLEPARQFDAWRTQCGSFVDLIPSAKDSFGYSARCNVWKIGPFALCGMVAEGAHYRRDPAQVRRDALDHWVIRLARRGSFGMRTTRGLATVPAGLPFVFSLANACEVERPESDWVSLVVPRGTFPGLAYVIDRRLHMPLDGSLGILLGRYLDMLEVQLPDMTEADLPRLVAATRAMITACIEPVPGGTEVAAPMIEHVRMERARQAIRQNLRSPTLTPKQLCRLVGMSRSQLYRLFEPTGGVARYIQAERLRQAHRVLADSSNRRDIHEVAEDLGFFDASAFSRTFRREYGCTPSEVRAAALSEAGDVALRRSPAQREAGTLTDVLRLLQ